MHSSDISHSHQGSAPEHAGLEAFQDSIHAALNALVPLLIQEDTIRDNPQKKLICDLHSNYTSRFCPSCLRFAFKKAKKALQYSFFTVSQNHTITEEQLYPEVRPNFFETFNLRLSISVIHQALANIFIINERSASEVTFFEFSKESQDVNSVIDQTSLNLWIEIHSIFQYIANTISIRPIFFELAI